MADGQLVLSVGMWKGMLCETRRVGKSTPNRYKFLTLNVNNYMDKH